MSHRVLPRRTSLTGPYWDACQRGELAIQRCTACRLYIHLPEPSCPGCSAAELTFEPVSGRGAVHTFTVVHRTFAPGFEDRIPYVLAWIELIEQPGLRAFGNVLDAPPDSVHIGQPVELCFEELPGFGQIPNFRAC
jgi:hypothetical protein